MQINFYGHVSQKNWKDSDKEVECTVECDIIGTRHETTLMALCPMTAIEIARKNFNKLDWKLKEKVTLIKVTYEMREDDTEKVLRVFHKIFKDEREKYRWEGLQS